MPKGFSPADHVSPILVWPRALAAKADGISAGVVVLTLVVAVSMLSPFLATTWNVYAVFGIMSEKLDVVAVDQPVLVPVV